MPVLILGCFAAWRDRRLLMLCLVPAAACMLYLTTTLQIMGFWSRYYVPYSAFLLFAALLVLDRRWAEGNVTLRFLRASPISRLFMVALCACLAFGLLPTGVIRNLDNRSEGKLEVYDAPHVTTPTSAPLPAMPVATLLVDVTDKLFARMPQGSAIAASEVGYPAARAPQATVIDLVGLNDTAIARHGFRMDNLYRKSRM